MGSASYAVPGLRWARPAMQYWALLALQWLGLASCCPLCAVGWDLSAWLVFGQHEQGQALAKANKTHTKVQAAGQRVQLTSLFSSRPELVVAKLPRLHRVGATGASAWALCWRLRRPKGQ